MGRKLRYAFLGATKYSEDLLSFLILHNLIPSIIFAIPKEFSISYSKKQVANSNYGDLSVIAREHNVKYCEVDSKDGKRLRDYGELISVEKLDLLLVLGFYYMIPKSIRDLAKFGSWGIHASLLPKYAGGAPLTWAIINGEKETGVTLFRMDDGVDDGDIIAQKKFNIEYSDTISEVYTKATLASKKILLNVFDNIDAVTFTSQDKSKIQVYPHRSPGDGEINFSKNAEDIYNFIRAQSFPYPGAFFRTGDGKKIIIEKARIED